MKGMWKMKRISIAIDGPSGAGKSTMAKMLAKELGFVYVDTGAMYRAVGLYICRKGIDSKDRDSIVAELPEIVVTIEYKDGEQRIILNGEDVSGFIRNELIGRYASDCSALPEVRAHLLMLQRNMREKADIIMDGRDIGTVVLPDASLKIFLIADIESRAKRRYDELLQKGVEVTFEETREQMEKRDMNDMNRAVAPLKAAEDAVTVDSTKMDIEETYRYILNIIRERLGDVL